MSDLHFDAHYVRGSKTYCLTSLCCRAEDGVGTTPDTTAGFFGSYGAQNQTFGCDAPSTLLESAVNYIAQLNQTFAAIILTGDYVAHDLWQDNVTEIVYEVGEATEIIRSTFPTTPLLPVVGNHEWYPADQFIVPQEGTGTQTETLLASYADMWSYLGSAEAESVRKGGYYTTLIEPGLRFVGMNSQYGDKINFWLYATNGICGPNQTAWFESTMKEAAENQERIIIASHIPCLHEASVHDFYCLWFMDIVAQYNSSIALILAGHTHTDEWVTLGDTHVQYVTPSVTPFSHKNPSFRIFGLTDDWQPSVVHTYYLDLAEANSKGVANWKLEYILPDAYDMPDLSAQSFDAVAESLLVNETRWTQWNLYRECSMTNQSFCETPACKRDFYCRLTSPLSQEYVNCLADADAAGQ